MEAPERIYLQTGLESWDDDPELTWDDLEEVTWCVDRINDSDMEYVRRDVAAKLWDMLDSAFLGLTSDEAPLRNCVKELLAETAWLADPPDGEESESE